MIPNEPTLSPFAYPFGTPGNVVSKIGGHLPLIEDVFERQRHLWNALCEIEADNRAKYRTIGDENLEAKEAGDKVNLLKERVDTMGALPRKTRDAEAFSALKQELKDARAFAKDTREKARVVLKPKLDALELERREAVKSAVKASDLWWCHSEVITERYDVARVRAMKTNSILRPARSGDAFGTLRVRWSQGIPLPMLFKGTTLASLTIEKRRTGKVCCALRLCVDSDFSDKEYITIPVVFSRDILEGATIRSISLFRRKTGDQIRWHGTVVVQQPSAVNLSVPSRPKLTLVKTELKDEPEFKSSIDHVIWLQSVLDKQAGEFFPYIVDEQEREFVLRKMERKGGAISYWDLYHLQNPSSEVREFLGKTYRMYSEMAHLRARAYRRRDYQYRLLAKDFTEKYSEITLEKPMMAFERKHPDRPAWGRFCEIMEQSGRRHGCSVVFAAPEPVIMMQSQADIAV